MNVGTAVLSFVECCYPYQEHDNINNCYIRLYYKAKRNSFESPFQRTNIFFTDFLKSTKKTNNFNYDKTVNSIFGGTFIRICFEII